MQKRIARADRRRRQGRKVAPYFCGLCARLGRAKPIGTQYGLRGDVLRVADIGRSSGTLINEGLTRWTLLDDDDDGPVRSGFGIAEYLHQLGDDGRPVVALE